MSTKENNFQALKNSGDWLHYNVTVLSPTELCTEKWLRW